MQSKKLQTMPPLFRPEVHAGLRSERLGRVLIHRPVGYTMGAVLAGVLILLVVAFLCLGAHTRKATVTGLLMPEDGMFRLASNSSGYVSTVKVSEGQAVESGDVLFVVSGEKLSATGGAQQQISEQLKIRLSLLERNSSLASDRISGQLKMLKARLLTIGEELHRSHEEIGFLGRRVELAKAHMGRQEQLVTASFISIAQLQQAEAELLMLQGQQQALRRNHANLQRERTALTAEQEDIEHRHKADISEIESGRALVRQEQAENDVRLEQVMAAPFKGIVTGISVQSGQQVTSGALLASIIPHDAKLAAHVYVSSRQVGFIGEGQTARLRYAAYPYQKFGSANAKVYKVSKSPYARQELPLHISNALTVADGTPELFYRVTLEVESQGLTIYGRNQPLQVGMLLEADIMQDTRKLYEWILDPIYAVTGKWGN